MAYALYRHPDVEQDLFDILDLIADYAGMAIAEHKLAEIEQSIARLAETPHLGSVRDDIHPGLRAIPTARKGVMTFLVDDTAKAVYLVSITYACKDWIRRIGERTGH